MDHSTLASQGGGPLSSASGCAGYHLHVVDRSLGVGSGVVQTLEVGSGVV